MNAIDVVEFLKLFEALRMDCSFLIDYYTQFLDLCLKSYGIFKFQPNFGHALSHCQCNKICPHTISLRNFEILLKIEILMIFKKIINLVIREGMCQSFGFLIQEFYIYLLHCQKATFVCKFQHTSLHKMMFFLRFYTSDRNEILWTCI